MRVRYPGFDFSSSTPRWGSNAEAVAIVNAAGIIPAAVERYLIRVMRRAKQELDPVADAVLIADIDVLNKQEGQHLKLHAAYLAMVRDGGYPDVEAHEAAYAADLDRFLAEESLAWNLGYCEGFESTGAATADAWVDGAIASLCGDRGSGPMRLWSWHLAEEFEHRTVVHDVLHRLFGPTEAHGIRAAGAAHGRGHIGRHTAAAASYLLEVDREGLSAPELQRSLEREQAAWMGVVTAYGDRLDWVFEPGYDPGRIDPPKAYEATLAAYG